MPKFEIHHNAGNFVSQEVAELIERYFSNREREKLERLGGLVTIKITSPFKTKEQRKYGSITIDDAFVAALRDVRTEPAELERILSTLTVKQLLELGRLLNRPIRTTANRSESVSELTRYFTSEEQWNRIAGTSRPDPNT